MKKNNCRQINIKYPRRQSEQHMYYSEGLVALSSPGHQLISQTQLVTQVHRALYMRNPRNPETSCEVRRIARNET